MNFIEHIIEPERLLLIWRGDFSHGARERRIVAEILVPSEESDASLRYLTETNDFQLALKEGFEGYPAFPAKNGEKHSVGVMGAFARRLPPRKRDDFDSYLQRHRLPAGVKIPTSALLAYTNAKLPSDSFEIYGDFSEVPAPFELVIEVAGFRHQNLVKSDDMYLGDPITFKLDKDNAFDENAVAIFYSGMRIGFVDRAQAPSFRIWMRKGYSILGTVERLNGKPDRPLVYIYASVR